MSKYAGIDFDTRGVHVVLIDSDRPNSVPDYMELPLLWHSKAFGRLRSVRDVMPARGWWEDEGVMAIAIEEPMQRGPASSSFLPKLKAVQGAIVACLPRDMPVNPMVPTSWKKTVGMKGNATKVDVEFWVRFSSPHSVTGCFTGCKWPQDAFDAYCLALSAQLLLEGVPA